MKIFMVIIIIGLILSGCISDKPKGENSMKDKEEEKHEIVQEETPATKEFIMETFELTEDDIVKYNVEELIEYFGLTEEFFFHEKETFEELSSITIDFERLQRKMLKQKEEGIYNYNFFYLIDAKEYKGDFPDIDTIRYLAVSHQLGTGGKSFVMDFEKNIIYDSYRSNGVYYDIRYAEKEIVLTEDKKSEIIQALKDAKIWDWDYMYSDNTEAGMESWWHMGIEFEDGTVISYNGAGMVPDNYKPLKEVLFER